MSNFHFWTETKGTGCRSGMVLAASCGEKFRQSFMRLDKDGGTTYVKDHAVECTNKTAKYCYKLSVVGTYYGARVDTVMRLLDNQSWLRWSLSRVSNPIALWGKTKRGGFRLALAW